MSASSSIPASDTDPVVQIGYAALYAKIVDGVTQLFMKTDDGAISPLDVFFQIYDVITGFSYTGGFNSLVRVGGSGSGTASITVTGVASGETVIVKQTVSSTLTVHAGAGQTIDNAASYTFPNNPGCVTLVFDGTSNWSVVSKF